MSQFSSTRWFIQSPILALEPVGGFNQPTSPTAVATGVADLAVRCDGGDKSARPAGNCESDLRQT